MVITTLQEKENRKFYVPIRSGNRGGWSLFEWQSVRQMPYRDRQMYLGNSAVIGVLDKGGKWRKRDWYTKTGKKYQNPNLTSEQQQAIKRDQQRMNAALGKTEFQDEERLTEEQMQELLKKIKNKQIEGVQYVESVGLGFDKSKVQIRAAPGMGQEVATLLPGINQIEESPEKQKRHKSKKQKKQKKIKKQKKKKKHKQRQQYESQTQKRQKQKKRQRSKSRSHRKKDKKKHKKHKRHYSSDSE